MNTDDVYAEVNTLRAELREALERFTTPADQPRRARLTKDDVLAGMLAGMARGSSEHHSVTLKSNAKGETQVEVTVRTDPAIGLDTPAMAWAEANRLYVQACETFGTAGFAVSGSKGAGSGAES